MRWWAAPAISLAALAATAPGGAHADPPSTHTVVLLYAPASDDVTTEATARVRGELKAAGFEVVVLARSADEAKRDLDTAGRELSPVAAFAIFVTEEQAGGALAEIWVSDRARRRTVIEHAFLKKADRAREAEVLAVTAVELLKANLEDLWTPAESPSPPAPSSQSTSPPRSQAISAPAAPSPEPPPARPATPSFESPAAPRAAFSAGWGVSAGVGVLSGFGRMGTQWNPHLAASRGWRNGFGVRASLYGLGPAAVLSAPSGSARVEQQVATLDAYKTWWPRAPVVPFVFGGVGAQHVHVDGVATDPGARGHSSDLVSLWTVAGAGVAIPLVAAVSVVAEASGAAAWPPSIIEVAGAEVGRAGAPSLLVDAALLAVLP